ncbi:MAG: hypothetical protein ACYTDU_02405 [Planctomycetota bacterium]|jgi:hypothetical protein
MSDAAQLALLLRQLLKQLVEQGKGEPTNDPKRVSIEADVALAKKAKAILEASEADVQREMTVKGQPPPRVVAGVEKAGKKKATLWLALEKE